MGKQYSSRDNTDTFWAGGVELGPEMGVYFRANPTGAVRGGLVWDDANGRLKALTGETDTGGLEVAALVAASATVAGTLTANKVVATEWEGLPAAAGSVALETDNTLTGNSFLHQAAAGTTAHCIREGQAQVGAIFLVQAAGNADILAVETDAVTVSQALVLAKAAPASKTAAGKLGEIRVSATHLYVCTTEGADGAANWGRVALDDAAWA